jgi:anthranilate phosphoribosyltransferase
MTGSETLPPTWQGLLTALVAREDLTSAETAWAMDEVMSGATSPIVLAGFLVGLRAKGETVAELTGLADSMLAHAVPIEIPGPTVDVVGTGGDRHRSVNISTMAALVVAGAGPTVVKHGNRAASSASGSADVLEALGVRLDLDVAEVAAAAGTVGITFCFAQVFHPSFRFAAAARRELGIPTTFNVLGPLTNPARPRAAAIGVADRRMAPLVAGVLAGRGTSALLFRSEDGLDELSTTAPADVWEVQAGEVTHHRLDPRSAFGLPAASLEDLRGTDAAYNAAVARRVLGGEAGPIRDVVLLNAAAALVADASQPGTDEGSLEERMRAALGLAARAVDEGAAAAVLDRWVAASG